MSFFERSLVYRADPAARDVVLALGFITWADGEPERGVASAIVARRLLRTLLRDVRVRRVLVVNPFRSAPGVLLGRNRRLNARADFPDREDASLYQPLRLRRREPSGIARAERAYRRWDDQVRRAATGAGLTQPAVITTSPLVAGMAPLEWAGSVTYYARDDYPAARAFGQARNRALFQAAYERIQTRGRAVAAVSQPIIDRIQPAGLAAVIPNAIDPDRWRTPADPHPALAALPRPRLLYVGGLDERLDRSMLRATAERFAEGSVVLVGPLVNAAHLEPLRELPNIHLIERVGRSEVPALMAAADVGILPHASDRGTRGMSPLKLYEYLAGGLPAAASDLPAVNGVDDRVLIAADGEPFDQTVARAVQLGRADEAERLAFIDANSWAERHRRLIDFALRERQVQTVTVSEPAIS